MFDEEELLCALECLPKRRRPMPLDTLEAQRVIDQAKSRQVATVAVEGQRVTIPKPFPSPEDWRDQWIYFLMVDRFNNPLRPPRQQWDKVCGEFQGGTLKGVQEKLGYLQDLGVGAIWLSPVQKNLQWEEGTYHGYGIHDFGAIDPRLTSDPNAADSDPTIAEREFQALVDEAHARKMYVILDIVLNHVGNVFGYAAGPSSSDNAQAPWSDTERIIYWRDEKGVGREEWSGYPAGISRNAGVWPEAIQRNECFRRKGMSRYSGDQQGDFCSLKELVTEYQVDGMFPVRNFLIHAFQYLIAKYDIDGFRIDTWMYIDHDTARIFGNAIREFTLQIGKRNFFMFGEVAAEEDKIHEFIGRNTSLSTDMMGIDSALDFPLNYRLPGIVKASHGLSPGNLGEMYNHRKELQRDILTSHGEAGSLFVTFLDNHDQQRHRFVPFNSGPGDSGKYDNQMSMGVGCLFSLLGIPCIYYGTEQGLIGTGDDRPEAVREALWGKPNAFDQGHPFYKTISEIAAVRRKCPPLRYGRQYFRPISGDKTNFGLSFYDGGGVLAFSRILNDTEIVVVANTSTEFGWTGDVIVDAFLNPGQANIKHAILYTNKGNATPPGDVQTRRDVRVYEPDGRISYGPCRVLPVTLGKMEIQILGTSQQ
jgi:glycosidase